MRSIAFFLALAAGLPASAANVYVLASGDSATDSAVIATLTAHGVSCTLGVTPSAFNGSQSLVGYQTVYLQDNANFASPMPVSGQQALVAWVQGGGRLVTCEWIGYYATASSVYETISTIYPAQRAGSYGIGNSTTYDQATPDPVINAGLPATLTFPLTSYSGSETYLTAKPGATVYYTSRGASGIMGLTGWTQGVGSVFAFSTTCGPAQLADDNFGRLFSNVLNSTPSACYANCDGSTTQPVLDVNDFICFMSHFAAGDTYANCDGSVIPPVLNANDFLCFQSHFAEGCQ